MALPAYHLPVRVSLRVPSHIRCSRNVLWTDYINLLRPGSEKHAFVHAWLCGLEYGIGRSPSRAHALPEDWFTPGEGATGKGIEMVWNDVPVAAETGTILFLDTAGDVRPYLAIGGEIWMGDGISSGEIITPPPEWVLTKPFTAAYRLAVWYALIDISSLEHRIVRNTVVELGAPHSDLSLPEASSWLNTTDHDPRGRAPTLLGHMALTVELEFGAELVAPTTTPYALLHMPAGALEKVTGGCSESAARATRDIATMFTQEGVAMLDRIHNDSRLHFSRKLGMYYVGGGSYPIIDAHGCGPAYSVQAMVLAHASRFTSAAFARHQLALLNEAIEATLFGWDVSAELRAMLLKVTATELQTAPSLLQVFGLNVLMMAISIITSAVPYRDDQTVTGARGRTIDESNPAHNALGDCEDKTHYAITLLNFVAFLQYGGRCAPWHDSFPLVSALARLMQACRGVAISGMMSNGGVSDAPGGHITAGIVWIGDSSPTGTIYPWIVAVGETTNSRVTFYIPQFIGSPERGAHADAVRAWVTRNTVASLLWTHVRQVPMSGDAPALQQSLRTSARDPRFLQYNPGGTWKGPLREFHGPSVNSDARTYPRFPRYWQYMTTLEMVPVSAIAALLGPAAFEPGSSGDTLAREMLQHDDGAVLRYTVGYRDDPKSIGYPLKDAVLFPATTRTQKAAFRPWSRISITELRLLACTLQMCTPPPHGGMMDHCPPRGARNGDAEWDKALVSAHERAKAEAEAQRIPAAPRIAMNVLTDMSTDLTALLNAVLPRIGLRIPLHSRNAFVMLCGLSGGAFEHTLQPLAIEGRGACPATRRSRFLVQLHFYVRWPSTESGMYDLLRRLLLTNEPPATKDKPTEPGAETLLEAMRSNGLWAPGEVSPTVAIVVV